MKLNTTLIALALLAAAAGARASTPDEDYWAAPGDTNMPSSPVPTSSPTATEHVTTAPAATTATPAPASATPAASDYHTVSAPTTATNITIAAADAPDTSVDIKNFAFAPTATTVTVGATVHWKNLDGEPHTVRSIDATFASGALDQNDSYSVKFDKPGTYKYVCSIHPQMTGTIVVKAAN